ncbi:MAG: RNA polymerase-binding protein DksA [Steroidobacteraceae bacterium]
MPVKKPSAKPSKAQKTVSAKVARPAAKPVAKPAAKAAHKPVTAKEKAVPRKTVTAAAKPAPKPASAKTKPTRMPEPVSAVKRFADADLAMNPSLLSGPRNVQPYQVSKGEEYMSKEQLEHFRTILSSWKQDLMQEVDRTVLHMKDEAANFPDPNDRATQESEFSLELRTRDRERKLIRKIDEALKRIEDGSYGYCLETGEPIGVKRLEARPVATLSVEAQERRERREKQFGDRDDFYR